MRRSIHLAIASCLLMVASSKAAPTQPVPTSEEEMDRQIGDMLQKLESANNLGPREKRAVNVLSGLLGGGGGGGGFLNELNKGPTYSQLLGGGGGFSKAGLLSGFLGSSSGTAVINRRPLVSVSVGGGAGIIDEDPEEVALRYNIEQQKEHNPLDLGGPQGGVSAHLAIPLRGPLSLLFQPPPLPAEDYDPVIEDEQEVENEEDFPTADGQEYEDVQARGLPPSDKYNDSEAIVTKGPYPEEALDPVPSRNLKNARLNPTVPRRTKKQKGGRVRNGNGGASASASASDGSSGSDAGAAAGGGSDSGSILGLVTPLLGSSSAGAAGGGADGGAGASVGVSLGGGAGGGANAADLWRETMALHYRIKSFIFRKLAQLLGTSVGSPQAG